MEVCEDVCAKLRFLLIVINEAYLMKVGCAFFVHFVVRKLIVMQYREVAENLASEILFFSLIKSGGTGNWNSQLIN